MVVKNGFSSFVLITLLFSCASNKITLETEPPIQISNAFYTEWVSGIKEGGTGLNLSLLINKEETNKKLVGIYFRNKYASLKFNKPNMYSGFIRTSKGERMELEVLEGKQKTKKISEGKESELEEESAKLPFPLKENEAVVVCLINNKKKYFKISLEEKIIGIPQ